MPDQTDPFASTRADEVLAEYMLSLDQGQRVDREQFIAAHAEAADELRAYFAAHDLVRQILDRKAEHVAQPPGAANSQFSGDSGILMG